MGRGGFELAKTAANGTFVTTEIQRSGMKWLRSIPIFIAVLTGCTLGIFKDRKSVV